MHYSKSNFNHDYYNYNDYTFNYYKSIRTFLQKVGFKVDYESYISENDVIYELLKFIPGQQNWNKFELEFGKFNLQRKCCC